MTQAGPAELHRLFERLDLLRAQIRTIEGDRLRRLAAAGCTRRPHAVVRLIARVIGVGVETADMLVHEIPSRELHDRRAGGALCRAHGFARRERQMPAREGAGTRRQCPRAAWHYAGLARSALPVR
ncbi:conserved hypothetical protein [Mesorhizobium metallidurans STM 2683]|uniref:Transposase n=1 Tax=Mesorhizobium metallidurans STM 2683 TaxID=1297569 RepID=M5FBC3_9HYPH|nr:conserved hypothetical protein [Mesorhizobium metallidurans STM 2683]